MKKTAIALLALVSSVMMTGQTITLEFTVGILSDQNGNPIPDGALIQVIASPDATFESPTNFDFVGGNDILVYSTGLDSASGGMPGSAYITIPSILLSEYPIAQNFLQIRWFPTLAEGATSPGFATYYGEFGYNNDNSWIAPSAAGFSSFILQTVSYFDGSLPDQVGQALNSTAPIPEPSTYAAVIGALALGFVAYRRRFAKAA